jgi:hypothetical protein
MFLYVSSHGDEIEKVQTETFASGLEALGYISLGTGTSSLVPAAATAPSSAGNSDRMAPSKGSLKPPPLSVSPAAAAAAHRSGSKTTTKPKAATKKGTTTTTSVLGSKRPSRTSEASSEAPASKKTKPNDDSPRVVIPPTAAAAADAADADASSEAVSERKLKWEKMFRLLSDYKEEYGTTVTVKTNCKEGGKYEGLHDWLRYQRARVFKSKTKKFNPQLLQTSQIARDKADQVKRLIQIGVVGNEVGEDDVVDDPSFETVDPLVDTSLFGIEWRKKFNLLKEYVAIFRTTNVDPAHCQGKFEGLDVWCKSQQMSYKRFRYRKQDLNRETLAKSSTARRLEMLKNINFDFGVKNNDDNFEKFMAELKQYKEKHGSCNVHKPFSGNDLFNFVGRMKSQLRKFNENPESSFLDQEKVDRLISLGGETFTDLGKKNIVKNYRPKEVDPDDYWEEQVRAMVPSLSFRRLFFASYTDLPRPYSLFFYFLLINSSFSHLCSLRRKMDTVTFHIFLNAAFGIGSCFKETILNG